MTFNIVKKIIVDTINCEPEAVTPEADLINDLEIDSLAFVELSMALEEELGIVIDDEKMVGLKTVADFVKLIDTLQAGN